MSSESTGQNPDAKLLALVDQHDQLWEVWDRLVEENEHDPRIEVLGIKCGELEQRIIATPANTNAGRDGKIRIIRKTGFVSDEGSNPATGDLTELVEAILALDSERAAMHSGPVKT